MSRFGWLRARAGQRNAGAHFAQPADWAPTAQAHADLGMPSTTRAHFGTDVIAGNGPAGHPFRCAGDRPLIVFGPAGSGKTSAILVPAVLEWAGSVVITSTSRDVLEHTVGWRATLGPVLVFAPGMRLDGPAGQFLRPWIPLVACLDRTGSPSWPATLRTARTMVSAATNGAGTATDEFWGDKAAELLAVALWAVICEDTVAQAAPDSPARPGTMLAVIELLARCQLDSGSIALSAAVAATGHPLAVLLATAALGLPPGTLGGIAATAMRTMFVYTASEVADAEVSACMRPTALLTGRATLYVLGTGPSQEHFRPVYTALLSWLVAEAEEQADATPGGRLDIPLLLAIDEAGTICPLPELARITATVRKAGLQLVTAWHDISQLDSRYGQSQAGTIMSNAGTVLVLPGLTDHRSTAWVEGAWGLRQVLDESSSESRSSTKNGDGERSQSRQQSTSRSVTRLPLVPAGAVPTMPPGTMLALIGRHRVSMRQRTYWQHRELSDRSSTPLAFPPTPGPAPRRLQPRPSR